MLSTICLNWPLDVERRIRLDYYESDDYRMCIDIAVTVRSNYQTSYSMENIPPIVVLWVVCKNAVHGMNVNLQIQSLYPICNPTLYCPIWTHMYINSVYVKHVNLKYILNHQKQVILYMCKYTNKKRIYSNVLTK